ncbi:MAG: trypsin-like peptidase domain-containing protein [Oscillospiraceae bacterium]|nr:trypsin-like peptidase domain-containing protein [Oscillospiraceae bacterium]
MYNDEFKEYHYSRGETARDEYSPVAAPVEASPQVERGPAPRQGLGVKAVALVLVCALVSGLCGFGGAAVYGAFHTNKTSVNQATQTAEEVAVTVKQVESGEKMTPAQVYASTVNSVVSINSTGTTYNVFGQQSQSSSSGTGFVITADGYIVTNQHVVKGADTVQVTLYSGQTYAATVIGGDSDYDVAVIKIDAADLQPVTLGSSDSVNVGDTVLAIGNPLGELTFSMSQGIVSSVNRAINVDGTPFNMIQVDASINPGNSGGPLMNLYGQVVGIVSAKYSEYSSTTVEGLGFAIPIDDVTSVITEIMESGAVSDKAYMAITCGTMTAEMAAQYQYDVDTGVFVYSVVSGGAGEKAGLQMGDVITKLNDTAITSRTDLTAALKSFRAGDTATVQVYRGGSYVDVTITFDARPQTTGSEEQQQQSQQQYPYGYQTPGMDDFFRYFFGNRG